MPDEKHDPWDLPPVKVLPMVENEIEERLPEKSLLAYENDLRSLLIREIKQRIWIRRAAFVCAISVMILMAAFLVVVCFSPYAMPRVHSVLSTPSYLAVVSVVAPIMSVSAICITILLGAFRKPTQKEDDNINVTSLAAEAVKSSFNS